MNEPYWLPRTLEEYRQQLAEDNGPQPDEMVRLQRALDAAEEEVARLQSERAAWRKTADLVEQQRDGYRAERDDALARLAAAEAALRVELDAAIIDIESLCTGMPEERVKSYVDGSVKVSRLRAALAGSRERAAGEVATDA